MQHFYHGVGVGVHGGDRVELHGGGVHGGADRGGAHRVHGGDGERPPPGLGPARSGAVGRERAGVASSEARNGGGPILGMRVTFVFCVTLMSEC